MDEKISRRISNLLSYIQDTLKLIPVTINAEKSVISINFQDFLICGIVVEEETYRIFNVSSDWKEKTSYFCENSGDGTWYYYLETIDECIGEVQRLVMFEAQKDTVTENNLNMAHFDEKFRIKQTDPELKDNIEEIKKRLSKYLDVKVGPDYYDLILSYKGVKIGHYWCKQKFIRLVIFQRILSNMHFSINVPSRTAKRIDKKTGQEQEFKNEFVLTQEEADVFLSELIKQI